MISKIFEFIKVNFFEISSILFLSFLTNYFLVNYALPFQSHVDEWTIIKDPLKILLSYKELDFSVSTNLYNWILTLYHLTLYIWGYLLGSWNKPDEYINLLALDSSNLLVKFRYFNLFLASLGNIIFYFFVKKLNLTLSLVWLVSLLFIFNPIYLNSINWVKFDAFSYLFYALQLYLAHEYFIAKRKDTRGILYVVSFIAVSLRIENIAFLISWFITDYLFVYNKNLKNYLSSKFIFILLSSVMIYALITLIPITFLHNLFMERKFSYTSTKTFEEVILGYLSLKELLNSSFYLKTSLYLLSPIVVLAFIYACLADFKKYLFLSIACVVLILFLSLNEIKNIFYFLSVSTLLLVVFSYFISSIQLKRLQYLFVVLVLVYFVSYDLQLIYYSALPPPNKKIQEFVLTNTQSGDTIVNQGIVSLGILDCPQMLKGKINAIKELGGTTGLGLKQQLLSLSADSGNCRNIFVRDYDYFWGNSIYENNWLIGSSLERLKELDPKLIIIASRNSEVYKILDSDVDKYFAEYIQNNFQLVFSRNYQFIDPRMEYRNFYYFHSFFLFKNENN